jgi:hypothetical protein
MTRRDGVDRTVALIRTPDPLDYRLLARPFAR